MLKMEMKLKMEILADYPSRGICRVSVLVFDWNKIREMRTFNIVCKQTFVSIFVSRLGGETALVLREEMDTYVHTFCGVILWFVLKRAFFEQEEEEEARK